MEDREYNIERFAGKVNLYELKQLLNSGFSQEEIDNALGSAIAYSKIEIAEYLIKLGADISYHNCDGVYYSAHNSELEGIKFSIQKGVDVNFGNGTLLNTSIIAAINTKNNDIIIWLLEHGANPKLISDSSLNVVERFGSLELKKIIRKVK